MRTLIVRLCLILCVGAFHCGSPAFNAPLFAADEGGHAEAPGPITADSGDVDLAFWTLIVFLIILVILKKFAWGPLSDGLNKREENIRKDIADAEAARVKAEQMLAAHAEKLDKVQDEVREIIAEARRDAEHTRQEIVETAQKEAEASKVRAVSEIERAKDAALDELFSEVSVRIADATEHVLGRALNTDDQERLIQDALSQFSEN